MPASPARHRLSLAALFALAAGVALLHAVAWNGVQALLGGDEPRVARAPVQVRTVQLAPTAATLPEAMPPVAAAPLPRPAPVRRVPSTITAPVEPATAQDTMQAAAPVVIEETPVLVAAALPAHPVPEPSLVAAADIRQNDVPVYRTRMPPAATLSYELTYGRWTGSGELIWRPGAQGYEARLEGRVAMMKIITLVSRGAVDAAGLAPTRYTDQRRGRHEQAANFQREAGKISFSGHAVEYPLLQGSQDRLSWMVQLAAIALAEPRRVGPGGRVVMHVVGARGDSDLWAFHVEGQEDVATPEGKVPAVKLVREPRKPHDTRVEVWLAPSLNYLPVRARQTTEISSWDLQLRSAQSTT